MPAWLSHGKPRRREGSEARAKLSKEVTPKSMLPILGVEARISCTGDEAVVSLVGDNR
jgi:hypothetical protein